VTGVKDALDVNYDTLLLISKRLQEVDDIHIGKLLVRNCNN
jgi:hypothetical protein